MSLLRFVISIVNWGRMGRLHGLLMREEGGIRINVSCALRGKLELRSLHHAR